ncbi:MAG: hypothetical protein E7399_03040 [Ruminococcaceae bacterium]|nr:hypothetical protein [Oscillospiraceae bacterium]
MKGNIVQRAKKLAFYGVPEGDGTVYYRMKGFTKLETEKNPSEYSRQYVDELFEETDVTGYSPSVSYEFDRYADNAVHNDMVMLTDGEMVGDDAVRTLIMADLALPAEDGSYPAIMRSFSVIPDSEGDGTDAYIYTGTFRAKGEKIIGTVRITDDIAVFTEQ